MLEYIDRAKEKLWMAFGNSAKDIVERIGVLSAQKLKKGGQSYPASGTPAINTGRFARALVGKENALDEGNITGDDVYWQRRLQLPYVWMLEKGGVVPVTQKMRKYFVWRHIQEVGQDKWRDKQSKWLAMARSKTLNHPALPVIRPTMDSVKLTDIIKKRVRQQFPSIKKVVTLGN